MVTAVVLHPPKFGATVATIDDSAALSLPGVSAVIPIAEGVAVVGETFDDAQRGVRALRLDWDDQHAERRSTEQHPAEHQRLVESGEKAVVVKDDGDVDGALSRATHVVDAIYELPISRTPRWNRTTPCAGWPTTALWRSGRAPRDPNMFA